MFKSNTFDIVSTLQIELPGYSELMRKESSYFLKHIGDSYSSWLSKYANSTLLPKLKTSDVDYSLELIGNFSLSSSDDNWKDTIAQELDIQTKLIGKIGKLYQHYRKIKCNPTEYGPIANIFKPDFKIPFSGKSRGVSLLDDDLTSDNNFCLELAITVKSGSLVEYQNSIISYIVNNNDSYYIDATYVPVTSILAFDPHRISLEKTNLKNMAVKAIPNVCDGMSYILDVFHRLSLHAPLLSLMPADEDGAIQHIRTVLQMSKNPKVENSSELPLFE